MTTVCRVDAAKRDSHRCDALSDRPGFGYGFPEIEHRQTDRQTDCLTDTHTRPHTTLAHTHTHTPSSVALETSHTHTHTHTHTTQERRSLLVGGTSHLGGCSAKGVFTQAGWRQNIWRTHQNFDARASFFFPWHPMKGVKKTRQTGPVRSCRRVKIWRRVISVKTQLVCSNVASSAEFVVSVLGAGKCNNCIAQTVQQDFLALRQNVVCALCMDSKRQNALRCTTWLKTFAVVERCFTEGFNNPTCIANTGNRIVYEPHEAECKTP